MSNPSTQPWRDPEEIKQERKEEGEYDIFGELYAMQCSLANILKHIQH